MVYVSLCPRQTPLHGAAGRRARVHSIPRRARASMTGPSVGSRVEAQLRGRNSVARCVWMSGTLISERTASSRARAVLCVLMGDGDRKFVEIAMRHHVTGCGPVLTRHAKARAKKRRSRLQMWRCREMGGHRASSAGERGPSRCYVRKMRRGVALAHCTDRSLHGPYSCKLSGAGAAWGAVSAQGARLRCAVALSGPRG